MEKIGSINDKGKDLSRGKNLEKLSKIELREQENKWKGYFERVVYCSCLDNIYVYD